MDTPTWLVAVAFAAAGLSAALGTPLAEATHATYCTQNFDYPPVCCPHRYLVAQHVDPRAPLAGVKNTVTYCDFLP